MEHRLCCPPERVSLPQENFLAGIGGSSSSNPCPMPSAPWVEQASWSLGPHPTPQPSSQSLFVPLGQASASPDLITPGRTDNGPTLQASSHTQAASHTITHAHVHTPPNAPGSLACFILRALLQLVSLSPISSSYHSRSYSTAFTPQMPPRALKGTPHLCSLFSPSLTLKLQRWFK